MPDAFSPSVAAVQSWQRLGLRVSLVIFHLGLLVVYLPISIIGRSAGVGLIEAGLALGLLLAPLEYALGTLCFAFVAASCPELGNLFQTLRWGFLGGGAALLAVRFFFRRKTARAAAPNTFGYLILVFLAISASTLLSTVSIPLTTLKLAAMLTLFYIASQSSTRLIDAYGPAGPRRFAAGLLAYSAAFALLTMAKYVVAPGSVIIRKGLLAGYLGNANAWAVFLITLLPWMASPLFRRVRLPASRQVALAMGLTLGLYGLMLSGSRAGMLGLLLATAFFCVVHADRRIAAAVLVLAILFTAKSLIQPDFVSRLASRYIYKHDRGQFDVLQSRLEPWRRAQQSFEERPWLGWGFGVSGMAQPEWTFDVQSGGMETGSSVWSSLSQVGIVGSAALFMAIVLLIARGGWFAWKLRDPCFTAIFGSTLALTANALFEGWLLAPGNYATTYFWLQCFFLNEVMCRFRPVPAHVRAAEFSLADAWSSGQLRATPQS